MFLNGLLLTCQTSLPPDCFDPPNSKKNIRPSKARVRDHTARNRKPPAHTPQKHADKKFNPNRNPDIQMSNEKKKFRTNLTVKIAASLGRLRHETTDLVGLPRRRRVTSPIAEAPALRVIDRRHGRPHPKVDSYIKHRATLPAASAGVR